MIVRKFSLDKFIDPFMLRRETETYSQVGGNYCSQFFQHRNESINKHKKSEEISYNKETDFSIEGNGLLF